MEKKRPQLSLDELHQLRWLLGGVLTLISISTVLYLEIDAWVLAGVATAAVLATLARPDLPARLPPLAHKLAFPFIVAFFAWDLYATGEWLPAIIRLDLLLLLYRGSSYRKKRDDLQIIVLGLILVMVAGVLTVSLAFAAQILVFTAWTLAFLFVITLAETAEGGGPAGAARPPGATPEWTRVHWGRLMRRLREVGDWRLLALGGGLFIGVVAVSALLFMAIPRFQLENSFFLDRFITKKSRMGFSESIRFGDVIDIQRDDSVALRVDVSDPARVPAVPYWRMVALDEYRGGELRTSRRLGNEMIVGAQMRSFLMGQEPPSVGTPFYWTFYFESGISRHLPITGPFYLLRFREPQWVQHQIKLRTLALRNEPVTMTAYRVEGMLADGFIPDRLFGAMLRNVQRAQAEGRATPKETDERGRRRVDYPLTTLQLPEDAGDQAVLKRMVDEITGGATIGGREFAAQASGWLRQRHGYSLQVKLPETERDPVVAWLESGLPGHCELFTAAFTLLARAAGSPTRAITGFKGGDWNAYENYFMVRNSHAHAWCEIYDGRSGWLRVDPTAGTAAVTSEGPSQTGGIVATRPIDRSWQARLDAVRILWYRRIVSFDQRTQMALVQSIRETTGNLSAAVRDFFDTTFASARRWLARPWNAGRALGWAGAVAGLIAAAALWQWRGRAWWWRFRGARRRHGPDPVRREAGRWLGKLGEGQKWKVEGRTERQRHSARPKVEGLEVWADLQRLRYGPRDTWPEPEVIFRRARRVLREERRAVSRR
jgi:transglutaminase-like putative cysteine protease